MEAVLGERCDEEFATEHSQSGVYRAGPRSPELLMALHDLKSPISAVVAGIEYLSQPEARSIPAERRELLMNKLRANSRRVLELIDQLLRTASGEREDLRLEPLDVVGLVRELLSAMEPLMSNASCTISLDAPEFLVGFWDRLRLWQILQNLVVNALTYGEGKPISMTIERAANQARITIQDGGPGMSLDDRQRAFEPFQRGAAPGNTAGHGLGLWIVNSLCEMLGGQVSVSGGPGVGCRFTVCLPIRAGKHASQAR
jgi:signal transduction histidine kinase